MTTITTEMIDNALARSPVKVGDHVRVLPNKYNNCFCRGDYVCVFCTLNAENEARGERVGTVTYVYYNGYALVEFPDTPIKGGMLNNNSTFKWDRLEVVA